MKRAALALFALLLLPVLGIAQTATITGKIGNISGAGVGSNAYLQVELYGCGNNRAMFSGGVATFSYQYVTDANGNFSGVIVRNDQITCGSDFGTATAYWMQPFINGEPAGPRLKFVVNANTFNWNTAPSLATDPVASVNQNGINASVRSKGFLSVLTDCTGVIGNGIVDDAPAINACIAVNPGRALVFPSRGNANSIDYFLGSALTPVGNGMRLSGETSGYAGGTTLKFPVGTKGFITTNATCQGCTIENFNILGSSPFTTIDKHQCVIPSTMEGAAGAVTGTSTDDGIQVGANFTHLAKLYINGWGRHGVYFTGGDIGGTQADDVTVDFVISYGNRGDGFYGHGGDFNASHFTEAIAYNNQFWGAHDSGFLGNTWSQPQVTGNHQDNGGAAGSSTAINISRAASVVTMANFTAHGLVVGNALVISGASDATYNGTWFVASVPDANTITFANASGATSGVTANARLATCSEAWTASTLDGGSYKAIGATQFGSWINPYAELSNGGSAKFAGHNMVTSGDLTFDTTQQNYHYTENGFHGSSYTFQANDSSHPNMALGFAPIAGASTLWQFFEGINGTENYRLTASAGSWQLQDQRAFGAGFRMFSGGIAQVDGGGGSVRLNSFSGAGVQFGNGAGVFPFTENQNGTITQAPLANGLDHYTSTRFTDATPTGNFQNFKSTAGTPLWRVDITGNLAVGSMDAARITSGVLGTTNGGTGQNSTATFPTSGVVETIIQYQDQGGVYAAAGTGDAYAATLAFSPGFYAAGQRFVFKANNANTTTTPTINFNSIGAATIKSFNGGALSAGDIGAGCIIDLEYDGTAFEMQSPPCQSTGTGAVMRNIAPDFAGVGVGFSLAGGAPAGHVPRGNGTRFVDAQLASTDLSDGTGTGTGSLVRTGSPTIATPTITGAIPTYDGIQTDGIGIPVLVAHVSAPARTATTSGNLIASATNGLYRITPYLIPTVGCATPGPGGVVLTFTFVNDNSSTETITLITQVFPAAITTGQSSASLTTATSRMFPSFGTSAITYAATYTACTSGTGTYDLNIILERLQ